MNLQEQDSTSKATSVGYGTMEEKPAGDTNTKPWKGLKKRSQAMMGLTLAVPKEAMMEAIEVRGGSLSLFVGVWGQIASVVASLLIIAVTNKQSFVFVLDCGIVFPELCWQRAVCDVTYPTVLLFPTFSMIFAVLLATWRFAYHRLYYVLLRNQVLLTFDGRSTLARAKDVAIFLQLMLFVMVISHEVLKIRYGYWGDTKGFSGASHAIGRDEDRILLSSFEDVVEKPALLVDPMNHNLLKFATYLVTAYIVPAVCAIALTLQASNMNDLIPLQELFDACPFTAQEHLSQSILLPEAFAKEVLQSNEVQRLPHDMSTEEVCQHIRQVAVRNGQICELGKPGKVEEESLKGKAAIQTGEVSDGSEVSVTSRWWPLWVVLKDGTFAKLWTAHCVLLVFFWLFEFCMRVNSFVRISKCWNGGDGGRMKNSTVMIYSCYLIPTITFFAVGLFALFHHLLALLLERMESGAADMETGGGTSGCEDNRASAGGGTGGAEAD